MTEKITAAITAVGAYLPEFKLTNAMLETMVDTNDEWIKSRTGVEERRILKGEGKGVADMGAPAVLELCKKRGIDPSEIDVLICCTVTADIALRYHPFLISYLTHRNLRNWVLIEWQPQHRQKAHK